jgi:uncharacterized protein YqjF (DUF2071 family)
VGTRGGRDREGLGRLGVNGFRTLLRAEWRNLAILNFEVDPSVLAPRLPRGLELDRWEDRHYVSVIGFEFLDLRVLGLPVPCHRRFDEVNFRFYVRRRTADGWRRGVVFIKELASCRAVAVGARVLYNEPYVALPMHHRFEHTPANGGQMQSVTYTWTSGRREQSLKLTTARRPLPVREQSAEAYFAERYWGYVVQRNRSVLEYQVERPRWAVAPAFVAELVCDVAAVYGDEFVPFLSARPRSAFFAEGSAVTLSRGVALPTS